MPAKRVLANDSDVDGEALTALLVNGPAKGTLTLSADGSFTYVPNANFNGSDSFTYRAKDSTTESNVATVTITVAAVNDAPVANGQSVTTAEDTAVAITLTGSDVDGDVLTFSVASTPAHGTLTGTAPNLTYTPAPNFNGPDSFTFTVKDGAMTSAPATVSITVTPVNDAPVANGQSVTTAEDTAIAINLTGSDADGDTLSFSVVTTPAHGALFGTAPSLTYTPAPDYNGSDYITFKVNDGRADSNVATVSITVVPVNDPPVANSDSYSTNEDTPLTVAAPGVLANDTDVDGPALSAVLVAGGEPNGTVVLNANGSFIYTPAPNFNGTATFMYKASDGSLQSEQPGATVTITVNPVNAAPLAKNDTYSVSGDASLTIPAKGVLANDEDVDGDELKAVLVDGPNYGTLTLSPDGSFTYTPDGFIGTVVFSYKANDGTTDSNVATVSITVTMPKTTANGKITGGVLRFGNNGRGGFNVQSDAKGVVKGELEYHNGSVNLHAKTMTAIAVSPDRTKGWFAGILDDGRTFVAYVEDNGEPGKNDVFKLLVDGVLQNGDGKLTGGNVQIHRQ